MQNVRIGLVCLLAGVGTAIACSSDSAETESASGAISATVGLTCTPSFEESGTGAGFSATEVFVEDTSPACGEGVCLGVNFEGRLSCPYGQDATGGGCETTSGEPVEGPVPPQLVNRPPSDAIYCSCRCADPEGADLCACPVGFECRELIQDLGLGSEQLAGSYCIKAGTFVEDPLALANGERCDESAGNCDDR